ncbi:hypothetical protein ACVIHI_002617 [Bradyrhizobium sp. USDA 4524]|uniref:hypothetical protein n=1 Tax=Bradyrhizobium TaxID=374 RepID=UPI0020A14D18|nr:MULTISPECIES: hypothetical protein [Bradyrhizobium]MCP1844462.1 hypothetical protein [Bradyrhizobium sp. USDA 4538]MCP1905028.1 hypothetical protein [Bradyrhizobium sp. USDA 4537]MCP1989316.1 hypothetical protein [Bradyrhizobium sp. USDA 4539]MCP3412487.1 hypothetical protein [Bradyrhizobium brasilense]
MPIERQIYRLSKYRDLNDTERMIQVVEHARKLLAESRASTFLGRKTQEPFPQAESQYGILNPDLC